MTDSSRLSRRHFIAGSTAALTTSQVLLGGNATEEKPGAEEFRSGWDQMPDRVWAGPEFWSNPLQDWRISKGRLECVHAAIGRSLHVLTRDLAERAGTVSISVKLGSLDGEKIGQGPGSAGFLLGVRGPLKEYRNNLVHGQGFSVGLSSLGLLFLGDGKKRYAIAIKTDVPAIELRFTAETAGAVARVSLTALNAGGGQVLGRIEGQQIPADVLVGNIALAVNYATVSPPDRMAQGDPIPKPGRWWFSDWRISGSKVDRHDDRAFGPILFNQYTLHNGVMKMTVQMPPLGKEDSQTVQLQTRSGADWKTIAEETIHPLARTATFRVPNWNSGVETRYRVAYSLRSKNGSVKEDVLEGLVRRDPVDQEVLTVADLSCNAHYAFPNTACVTSIVKLNPDLLAFTGDQYYESTGGFGVERYNESLAILDVLRKWFQHGWTWRALTKDRPTVSIPDDHDVYHGNLWGENGKAAPGQDAKAEAKGGYKMMANVVNVVHRTQTAHHPDSPAPAGLRGVTGYYSPLKYGRVSFAILADRQYKSGPDGKVPATTSGRADHVTDPSYDPQTADLPGLQLLGDEQLSFLKTWGADWKGADMKAVISQTIFTAMATHHGKRDGYLVADYDTNAWPQTARDAAVRALRRACAFHIAGDQHLPAVVHYGVEGHRDGVIAFASPAVNNLYPRWFLPKSPGENRKAGAPETHGDFKDSFGHPLTVLACANPQDKIRPTVLEAETDKSSGFGVVRFNKKRRTITVECWPLLADVSDPKSQFPDWPVTVGQLDGLAGVPRVELPRLQIHGCERPVIHVREESTGERVYSLRLPANIGQPLALTAGLHTIIVEDPETDRRQVLSGLMAGTNPQETKEVFLS